MNENPYIEKNIQQLERDLNIIDRTDLVEYTLSLVHKCNLYKDALFLLNQIEILKEIDTFTLPEIKQCPKNDF